MQAAMIRVERPFKCSAAMAKCSYGQIVAGNLSFSLRGLYRDQALGFRIKGLGSKLRKGGYLGEFIGEYSRSY